MPEWKSIFSRVFVPELVGGFISWGWIQAGGRVAGTVTGCEGCTDSWRYFLTEGARIPVVGGTD